MKINMNYILKLLEKEEYEEAIGYLDDIKSHEETRLGNQLLRIIMTMNRINNFNKYDYPRTDYKNSKERYIARFYEALKFKDFKEALDLVDICIDYLDRNGRDIEEMKAYKEVLKYANIVQERTIKRSNNLTKMSNLTYEIEVYATNNKKVKYDDLYWLIDNIEEIMDISRSVNRDSNKMKYASEIIYTIFDFNDGIYRDTNYFGNVSDYSNVHNTHGKLYAQLENGQYPSAYKVLKKYITHSKGNVEWIYKLYYMLLNYLKDLLNQYQPKDYIDNNYIVYNQIINYDKLFKQSLKNNNNDPELLANIVLAKVLNKK